MSVQPGEPIECDGTTPGGEPCPWEGEPWEAHYRLSGPHLKCPECGAVLAVLEDPAVTERSGFRFGVREPGEGHLGTIEYEGDVTGGEIVLRFATEPPTNPKAYAWALMDVLGLEARGAEA